jgi:hypothetical protein
MTVLRRSHRTELEFVVDFAEKQEQERVASPRLTSCDFGKETDRVGGDDFGQKLSLVASGKPARTTR